MQTAPVGTDQVPLVKKEKIASYFQFMGKNSSVFRSGAAPKPRGPRDGALATGETENLGTVHGQVMFKYV